MRWLSRGKTPQPDDTIPEMWAVFGGQNEGLPLIARFNVGAKRLVGDRRYGIQIGVAVPFNEQTENGLPTPEEQDQLAQFEDALEKRAGENAVFVGVITTGNMREFVFYTGSEDWIEPFYHQLQAGFRSHEVQVMSQPDPKWSVYRQFVR